MATHPYGGAEIPVGVSARHCHLSAEDAAVLFGPGAALTPDSPLSQPGQFAAKERLVVAGPRGAIAGVRVLGPTRALTQVELSVTDAITVGLRPPVRESGVHRGTPGLVLIGPCGSVTLESGVIIAQRHIHMHPDDERRFGVRNGNLVWVAAALGDRRLVFGDVLVRVSERYRLEFHIDTDEANAAGLRSGETVVLVKP